MKMFSINAPTPPHLNNPNTRNSMQSSRNRDRPVRADMFVRSRTTIAKLTKSQTACARRHLCTLEDHKLSHAQTQGLQSSQDRERLVRADAFVRLKTTHYHKRTQ